MASDPPVPPISDEPYPLHAGLATTPRERTLTTSGHRRTVRALAADWRALVRVGVTERVLALVPGLARRYPLRGFDAIHLASAVRLQSDLAEAVSFVAADERLLAAAAGERLTPIDVSS
ncbi:MAG: type II toxin-antitoxin system VapC family toxin [Deltaproteobacteria bacterium]|nr:type II toxin-antitoxin system VapC family toxin [Deltaproteobacteria bacterium]